MEIVLALIMGLAVACVVFVLGRMLVGSKGSADRVPQQPELSLFASVASAAAGDAAKNPLEIAAASEVAPLSEPQELAASKKARKPSAARLGDVAKSPSRPRRRKKPDATLPGADVVQ